MLFLLFCSSVFCGDGGLIGQREQGSTEASSNGSPQEGSLGITNCDSVQCTPIRHKLREGSPLDSRARNVESGQFNFDLNFSAELPHLSVEALTALENKLRHTREEFNKRIEYWDRQRDELCMGLPKGQF